MNGLRLVLRTAAPLAATCLLALPASAQDGVIFDDAPEVYPLWGDSPGLCRLEFKFLGGDQHLRTLQALPDLFGSNMQFDLADNDHGQGVYSQLRWWDMRWGSPSLRFASVSSCNDGCYLSIPPIGAGNELVLAGIDLRFLGSDRHIRDIEVWAEPENSRIWVRLRDNSSTNAFSARIAYLVLPVGNLRRSTSFSSADEWADINRPKAAGRSYLQGFKARFRNGDHHLERLWVDVCTSRIRGTFHDGGGVNDPYRLDLRYVSN